MFYIYQNQSKETEPNEEINEEKLVNVDITTQITDVVENVTPAVVGITNVQKRPEDFWREDQSFENDEGTGSGVIYKVDEDKAFIITNHHVIENVTTTIVGITNVQKRPEDFWREDQSFENEAGTGSGVIYKVDEDKAFIITNHHVIENADSLEVILSTEEKLEAELLGSDLFMDLAVLQVNSEDIEEVVDIGTSENINVGEPVIAIGNPLSHMFAGSVTQGIISSKQRSIPQDFNQDGRADWQAEVLQT